MRFCMLKDSLVRSVLTFKKGVTSLVLVGALALPTAALASSYGFIYDFKHELTSTSKTIRDTDNVAVYTNTTSWTGSKLADDEIKIELHRVNFWSVEYISYKNFYRYGEDTGKWAGVGKGDYRVILKKAQDGQYLQGSGSIYNY